MRWPWRRTEPETGLVVEKITEGMFDADRADSESRKWAIITVGEDETTMTTGWKDDDGQMWDTPEQAQKTSTFGRNFEIQVDDL